MEVVTHSELAECLDRLCNTIRDALSLRPTPNLSSKMYLTCEDAAEYLRVSESQIGRLTSAGILRRAKIGEGTHRRVLFRRKDIDEYVDGRIETD